MIISFICGVSGTALSGAEREFLAREQPYGVILFARNVESPAQVSALTAEITSLLTHPYAEILIDPEGGRVARMRPPHWRAYPPALVLAAKADPARAVYVNARLDYESLVKLGSIMGSGGMIVMDETSNMVDVARYFMEFCKSESCGKCVPCRVGTVQMYDLLDQIYRGEGTRYELKLLENLCTMVREMSLCGLGQTAPNPVNSTLRYFRHEYLELLRDGDLAVETAVSTPEVQP